MTAANLIEIFTSFQGEGAYLGREMTFVRFQNCALSCRYCDTPASFEKLPRFRRELKPHSADFESLPNPVSAEQLTELLPHGEIPLSLTGGEPLQHADFLKEWLTSLNRKYLILLETNGVLHRELEKVLEWIDVLSMDIKLASATGMKNYWDEHEQFLKVALQQKAMDVYVKAVISPETPASEIEQAARLTARQSRHIPFFIQPVTGSAEKPVAFSSLHLKSLFDAAKKELPEVRLVPQVHPALNIL